MHADGFPGITCAVPGTCGLMLDMPPGREALSRYGREVRTVREDAELTQTALANLAATSKSTISAVERGITVPAPRLRGELCEVLESRRLERVWEELTGDGREAWKTEVAALIEAASAVYEYLVLVWPAHLQTEAYARALVQTGACWLPRAEVQGRAKERARRAAKLKESESPRLWLVFDESLLSRRYGGIETTKVQLASVIELAERGRICTQMIRSTAEAHPGSSGPFKLITTENLPDILFSESAREGQLVTNTAEVTNWRMQFAALQSEAAGPDDTLERMRAELAELRKLTSDD